MKLAAILVFAVALTSFQTTLAAPSSHLRGLQATSVNFAALNKAPVVNGMEGGDKILATVNESLGDGKKINADQLLSISKRMSAKDPTLLKADASTLKIVLAIRAALGKLYPGEADEIILRRVLASQKLPEVPKVVDDKLPKKTPELPKAVEDKLPKSKTPELPKVIDDKLPKIKTPELPKLKELRHLQAKSPLESVSFADESRAASLNGVKAGEEILATVNKLEPKLFVNGDQLLKLAVQMAVSEAAALKLADEKTKKIGAALKKAIEQLFPGQKLVDVLKKLLPIVEAAVKAK
jgi:hypothetical protein